MSRMWPDSVYFEPTGVWLLNRADGSLTAPSGLCVHAKVGNRWRKMTLLPSDGETFGGLCARIGDWYAESPGSFVDELFAAGAAGAPTQ